MANFDHLAVSAGNLAEGVASVEAALGVGLTPGGAHPFMGTHNRLLSLGDGEYLEVIAIDPDAPPPGRPRWFRLDRFNGPPKLTNWIARVSDLDAVLAVLTVPAGRASDLARGDFRWRMAVPDDGCLPFDDAFPALIQWRGDLHPANRLPDRGCRLTRLEIAHPEAEELRKAIPVNDPRIVVVPGEAALRATIRTPGSTRILE